MAAGLIEVGCPRSGGGALEFRISDVEFSGASTLLPPKEFLDCYTNIRRDLSQQNRRNISALVKGDRGCPAIGMAELPV